MVEVLAKIFKMSILKHDYIFEVNINYIRFY